MGRKKNKPAPLRLKLIQCSFVADNDAFSEFFLRRPPDESRVEQHSCSVTNVFLGESHYLPLG